MKQRTETALVTSKRLIAVATFSKATVLGLSLLVTLGACSNAGGLTEAAEPRPSAPEPTSAPAAAEPEAELATVELSPPGHPLVRVTVELARTVQERQQGLMYRKQLAPDAGMLFLFEEEKPLSFWMRNTYVPLDMIFIGSDLRIVGIVENAEPLTDDSRSVDGHSQYVLEVNAGFSREHGLATGTAVAFVGVEGFVPPDGAP
ncbi:MAG: DUF192 domain-containing protein [Myxococcales bacterium]|nr:DUF192 domain-containing protein [Myxococcales bacterium]